MIETEYDKICRTKGGEIRYEKTAVLDRSGLLYRRSGLLLFLSCKRMDFSGHCPVWIVRLILPSFYPYSSGRDLFLFCRFHAAVLPFVRASLCQTRPGPVRSYALFVRHGSGDWPRLFSARRRDRKRPGPERAGLVQHRYGPEPVSGIFRHRGVVRHHLHRPV